MCISGYGPNYEIFAPNLIYGLFVAKSENKMEDGTIQIDFHRIINVFLYEANPRGRAEVNM